MAKKAGDVYQKLNAVEKGLARHVFTELAGQGADGKFHSRRRVFLDEIVPHSQSLEGIKAIADKFSRPDARFITLSDEGGTESRITAEIAHEALFSYWDSLEKWIGEKQEDLPLARRLKERCGEWNEKGKSTGLLWWQSPELENLREFHKRNSENMTKLEKVFYEASEEMRREVEEKERRNQRFKKISIVVLVILAVFAIFQRNIALKNEKVAKEQERIAQEKEEIAVFQKKTSESEAEAVRALAHFETGKGEIEALHQAMQSGVKLRELIEGDKNIQNLKDYPTVYPVRALQNILTNIREKNQFKIHDLQVNLIAFSPKKEILAIGGYDGTVRLFDFSGKEMKKWKAYPRYIECLEFTPDGERIVTGNRSESINTYHIWDTSGNRIAEMKDTLYDVSTDVSISSDGKIAGIIGGRVHIWNWDGNRIDQIRLNPEAEYEVTVHAIEGLRSIGANTVCFSPDNRQLVIGSATGDIHIYDLSEHKKIKQFKAYKISVSKVSVSSDGSHILSQGSDKARPSRTRQNETIMVQTSRLWRFSGRQITEFEYDGGELIIEQYFTPDGKQVAVAGNGGIVQILDFSGKTTDRFRGHKGAVGALSFHPNGKIFATGGRDSTVRIWNFSKTSSIQITGYPMMSGLHFSPDGEYISTAGILDNAVRVYNMSSEVVTGFKGSADTYPSSIFRPTPDGRHFILVGSKGKKGYAALFDLSGKKLKSLEADVEKYSPISNMIGGKYAGNEFFNCSDDGNIAATIDLNFLTRIWDFSNRNVIRLKAPMDAFRNAFNFVRVSPNGRHILTIGLDDDIVRVWDSAGQYISQLDGGEYGFGKIVESPGLIGVILSDNGKQIVQLVKDSTAIKAGLKAGDIISEIDGKYIKNGDEIYPLLNGQAGTQVQLKIIRGEVGNTQALDFTVTREKLKFVFGKSYNRVAFCPDNKHVATWIDEGNSVQLWEISGKPVAELKALNRIVRVCFSPDGKFIAISDMTSSLRVWNLSGEVVTELKNLKAPLTLTFSPDEQRIATFNIEGTVRIWDMSGREIARYDDFEPSLMNFSPDGKNLALQDDHSSITILPIKDLDGLLSQGCNCLKDYLSTHTDRKITICQNSTILAKAEKELKRIADIEKSKVNFHLMMGRNLAEAGEFEEATKEFWKAIKLKPDLKIEPESEAKKIVVSVWLKKGYAYAEKGEIKNAIFAYSEAEKIDSKLPAESWCHLCWQGCIGIYSTRNPAEVIFACEKALQIAKQTQSKKIPLFQDFRGVARAMNGDTLGAIDDFESFVGWVDKSCEINADKKRILEARKLQRQHWLDTLRNGGNIFENQEDFYILDQSNTLYVDFYYIGQVAEKEGDLESALFWYRKVNSGSNFSKTKECISKILIKNP